MRWMTWIVAPLAGVAGAVAVGWLLSGAFAYYLGAALAPVVTATYAAIRGVPLGRTVALGAID